MGTDFSEDMQSQEIRDRFRTFFNTHTHQEVKSDSLIPASDDPTVLFTTAGMQQFIPNLLGAPHPQGRRLYSTQKCLRTPDIEEVGDDTHLTFFEMLGNWSIGDYFKQEAIDLAYDYFVKELGLDPKRFAITIFGGDSEVPRDDEAEAIWLQKPGITPEQIYEFDRKDNFWGPAGATGPCGPCSEIHYDRGPEYGEEDLGPNADDATLPDGRPYQRYVEIWNLVFMEYDMQEDGSLQPLAQKNVDTGVGFERLAAVMQQKDSPYETDILGGLIGYIESLTGGSYEENPVPLRIIADHVRSGTFLLADGVLPSNEGRGYVLRRVLRRAIRQLRLLGQMGQKEAILPLIAQRVIADFSKEYPELVEHQEHILMTLRLEEESFLKTLEKGEMILEEILQKKPEEISGEEAFQLFDTYGFPVDMTREIARERGVSLDEEGYKSAMKRQQERSRSGSADAFQRDKGTQFFADMPETKFLGYVEQEAEAKVLGVLELEGGGVQVVLNATPFYAESGGQVGDSGLIEGENGVMQVVTTQKTARGVYIHTGTMLRGSLSEGEQVSARINTQRRDDITRHHSLAHLFLAGAKKVLGSKDITQAGSHVNEKRMRIDFTWNFPLSGEEIRAIEDFMAEQVLGAYETQVQEKSLAEAKVGGAEATFGEKYGDVVRTVRLGPLSYELCGGTHVKNTAEIGAVKILTETGVSSGVRRVEVVCGRRAQELLITTMEHREALAAKLKTSVNHLDDRTESMVSELKELRQELGQKNAQLAEGNLQEALEKEVKEVGGLRILLYQNKDLSPKTLPGMQEAVRGAGVDLVVICAEGGAGAVMAPGAISAVEVLRRIGKGGGSETFAQGKISEMPNLEALGIQGG